MMLLRWAGMDKNPGLLREIFHLKRYTTSVVVVVFKQILFRLEALPALFTLNWQNRLTVQCCERSYK